MRITIFELIYLSLPNFMVDIGFFGFIFLWFFICIFTILIFVFVGIMFFKKTNIKGVILILEKHKINLSLVVVVFFIITMFYTAGVVDAEEYYNYQKTIATKFTKQLKLSSWVDKDLFYDDFGMVFCIKNRQKACDRYKMNKIKIVEKIYKNKEQ